MARIVVIDDDEHIRETVRPVHTAELIAAVNDVLGERGKRSP
jgi:hypothetical protein